MNIKNVFQYLPEIETPTEKKLSFNVKIKWTLIILVAFFALANIPLYGLASNSLARFENLAVILGADFGSLISLGIGPIVMASIILQLLVGSKIININTTTSEGKKFFQGIQKLLVLFFIVFEACVYVLMNGLQAAPGYTWLLLIQLFFGGLAIFFMDEIMTKWGFGSGTSLFIAAGVSRTIFTRLFQFLSSEGTFAPSGQVLVLINSIISANTTGAILAALTIIITIIIFFAIVWAQSLKVEIPLSFDRLRGYGMKWPLQFFYTSNLPVILVAALSANIQLAGELLENWLGKATIIGGFSQGVPISGLALWISPVNLPNVIITGSFASSMIPQLIGHLLFYVFFSVIFAIFWVRTSGMDAQSQAKNIMASGLTIPGFRKDERILESVLERYIFPLTVMGGAALGLLSAVSDISGAIVGGTSMLLVVMIMYQFYQNIAQQHSMDMYPALKKIIK